MSEYIRQTVETEVYVECKICGCTLDTRQLIRGIAQVILVYPCDFCMEKGKDEAVENTCAKCQEAK